MSWLRRNQLAAWQRWAQFAAVLLCAFALKLYYSNASANELRWILAPTTALVELVSGASFEFESYVGYMSGDRTFVIAPACAGVNFLITAFLMLTLRKLWRDRAADEPATQTHGRGARRRSRATPWSFIPLAALVAYVTTLVANTTRISIALWLRRAPLGTSWLNANQLHRLEGILVYFGFLLLLFLVSEWVSELLRSRSVLRPASLENAATLSPHASRARREPSHFRRSLFPLFIYYLTALGLPLANSVYHRGTAPTDFWEHSLFVFLTPLGLVVIVAAFRAYNSWRSQAVSNEKRARVRPSQSNVPTQNIWRERFISLRQNSS